jgi:hypothetical protein
MREFERMARKDDMWDIGCKSRLGLANVVSHQHGLADVLAMQKGVIRRMAEIVLEEATAMLIRSDFLVAEKVSDHQLVLISFSTISSTLPTRTASWTS